VVGTGAAEADIAASALQLQHQIFLSNATLGILLATIGWLVTHASSAHLLDRSRGRSYPRGNHNQPGPVVRGRDEIAILSEFDKPAGSHLDSKKDQSYKASNQVTSEPRKAHLG